MDIREPEANIVELMAKVEEMMEKHYQACAERFIAQKDFWNNVAQEEANHKQWLRDLYGKVKDNLVFLDEKRFNKTSIKEFHKHLQNMLQAIQLESVSMKEALQNSIQKETLLLEKNFFEIFKTDSEDIKRTINRIVEDTKNHRLRMEELLISLSASSFGQ